MMEHEDRTALATAIAAMREAVATTDEAIASIPRKKAAGDPLRYEAVGMAEANEAEAGRVLLVALDGIPERVAALEELAARALVFSESFRYLSDNYTHCNCPRFDEDAQDSFEGALVALAALGETDGD